VPQGAEHRAVCRGLRGVLYPPAVFGVPVGAIALTAHLERLQQAGCFFAGQQVLVMGLCGGLTPELAIGTPVLYDGCSTMGLETDQTFIECDRLLTAEIHQSLNGTVQKVKAVTSDRVISRAVEKSKLAEKSHAAVVDMEGFSALKLLRDVGVAVATLRVVSDDSQYDIPNLTHAFDAKGSLKPLALATAMLKQPIAALRLIRGSTQSLKILQNLTSELFKQSL